MVKKKICEDEMYPVYSLYDMTGDIETELTDEEWADYERVMFEFEDWQEKLEALYNPVRTGKHEDLFPKAKFTIEDLDKRLKENGKVG